MDELSKSIRREILTEAYKHKHGHIASCFSCVEILLAIKEIMKEGDHFILSKGHAILAEKAVFGKEISCYKTGSLGHGLGVACGIALGDLDHNVYVVVGDGELQEGSCWEAIQFIINNDIENVYVFIDANGYQASKKISAFTIQDMLFESTKTSWITIVDGHNIKELIDATYPIKICETVKGKGVSFVEADPVRWHTEIPSEELYQQALVELA